MAFSRREFVRRLGVGGAAIATASHIIGYGREELLAFTGEQGQRGGRPAASGPMIRLSSNENLRGPSPKVIEVLQAASFEGPGPRLSAAQRQRVRGRLRGHGRRETEQHHHLNRLGRNPHRGSDGVL